METLGNLRSVVMAYGAADAMVRREDFDGLAPTRLRVTCRQKVAAEIDAVERELAALRADVTDYKAKAGHYAKRTAILAEALADAGGKVMAYSNDPQLVRMVNDILLRAAGMKQ